MDAGLIERIETGAGQGTSALFAAAVGYAAFGLLASSGLQSNTLLAAGAGALAGALAYLPCSRLLGLAQEGSGRFVLPDFALCGLEFVDAPDELLLTDRLTTSDVLVLTDSDRVDADARPTDQAPLVLDDILAEIGPGSRVVRLFDRKAMPASGPTPGQLQSRIARHLGDGTPPRAPSNASAPPDAHAQPDASQALSAALDELRRSLR